MIEVNGIVYQDSLGETPYMFSEIKNIDLDELKSDLTGVKFNVVKDGKFKLLNILDNKSQYNLMQVIQKIYINQDTRLGVKNKFNT